MQWCVFYSTLAVFLSSATGSPLEYIGPKDAAATSTPAAIAQLVAGIDYNIMAQNGEMAVLSGMQKLVSGQTPDPALWNSVKDDLLAFMSGSMRIRGNNMKIPGIDPQIERGLAQLEATQVIQMSMANNLTGTAGDAPLLDMLQGKVKVDIEKNSMLQAMATGGTGPAMLTKPAVTNPAPTQAPEAVPVR